MSCHSGGSPSRCTKGEGSWTAPTRLAELADPNAHYTWLWRLNPPLLFGPAFSGKYVFGCAVPTARNLLLVQPVDLASWTRAPRNTPSPPSSMLQLVRAWFLLPWSVCVQVVDVGMYVRGAACCACCDVLQRCHKFDAILKRFDNGYVQRRVTAYQMTVCVDICVFHDSVDHG